MGRRTRVALARCSSVDGTLLELDHVFCMVTDPDGAARRLEADGWVLDAGQAHRGQGTRNRRLAWPEQFFELLWVTDTAEASANPLRLDRRADRANMGASPFGLAFRGQIHSTDSDQFWLYDALGPRIWIHRDNERCPARPLVLVLETAEEQKKQRRASMSEAAAHRHPGELREARVHGPSVVIRS
jgi:glyoxalase-like protein